MSIITDAAGVFQSPDGRWSTRNYFLLSVLITGLLIGFDLLGDHIHNGDVDDALRAMQVRAFLEDGNWFGPRIPNIYMPGPYISA